MFLKKFSGFIFIISTIFLLNTIVYGSEDIIVTHGFSMGGEPKYPKDFTNFDYANPNAPKGGLLRNCSFGSFDSFNPYILKGNPARSIGLIYDTLLVSSDDEPSSYYGLMAEKIEYPEDISWVIFHINKNAKFHDGKSIRAKDIIFSYNALMDNFGSVLKRYYQDIKSAKAIDGNRVKFEFKKKFNMELLAITGQIPALPAHFWKDKDFSKADLLIPLGSGPYRLKKFKTGRSITYERVKDYWAKDIPVMKGRYNFDLIRFDYYRDTLVALEAFKAGLHDYSFEGFAKRWIHMYKGPEFDNGNIIKTKIPHNLPVGMQGLVFNTRRPLFNNPDIRKAIIYAFDYEWVNKKFYYGEYKRINSYFSNCELKSPPLPSKEEKEILKEFKDELPKKIFTKKYLLPVTDGSGHNRNNLIKASKLLEKEGYYIVKGKLINKKTKKPFRFELMTDSMGKEKVLLPFQKNLKKLGIEMVIKRIDSPQYTLRLRKSDFDMIIAGFGAKLTPGRELNLFWHSSTAFKKDSRNFAGVNSDIVDSLIERIVSERERKKMIPLVHALDRILLWGNYVIPLGASNYYRLAHQKSIKRPGIIPYKEPGISTWWKEE